MIVFENDNISVEIDEQTGYTFGLYGKDKINWVLTESDWGHVDGFKMPKSVLKTEKGVRIEYASESYPLHAVVEKEIYSDRYVERYSDFNDDFIEFFFREGDFGTHFPFENVLLKGQPWLMKAVNAHAWCGNNIAWIQAKRMSGVPPYLYVYMTDGNICSYDISRNVDRTVIGMDYRGDLVLNPQSTPILPGKCITSEFTIRIDEREADDYFSSFNGHIALDASPYTSVGKEPITLTAKFSGIINSAQITLENKPIEFEKNKNTLTWTLKPNEYKEYTFFVTVNGKKTHIRVNALPKLEDLLMARARFIVRKQQYICEGSHLDGAYLIYESTDDSQYFSRFFHDHNSGRERICMGLTVAQAVILSGDAELEESLKRYVTFIERELFNPETGEVFESENRNNKHPRIFNYPWFACFYLELYNIWGEKKHLINAVNIVRQYYLQNGSEQDSQCMPICELVNALKAAGEEAFIN